MTSSRSPLARKRWWVGGVIAAGLAVLAGLGVLVLLATRPLAPPAVQEDSAAVRQAVERLESQVRFLDSRRHQAQRVPFELILSQEEANQWLAQGSFLPELPSSVRQVRVAFAADGVEVWAQVRYRERWWSVRALGSLSLNPSNQRLVWRPSRLQVGRLVLPVRGREQLMARLLGPSWWEGLPVPEGMQLTELRLEAGRLTVRGLVGR